LKSAYLCVSAEAIKPGRCPICRAEVMRISGNKVCQSLAGWALLDTIKVVHDASDVASYRPHSCLRTKRPTSAATPEKGGAA
jgi:hypothetical protein